MILAAVTEDCEAFRYVVLGQPASTVSSLVFLAAGVWFLWRGRRVRSRRLELSSFGFATILVGLGSIAFHGPHPGWGQWAHDVTIAWLLLLAIVVDAATFTGGRARELAIWVACCGGVAFLFWSVPESQRPIFAVLAVELVLLELIAARRHLRPWPGDPAFGRFAFAVGAFVVGTLSFFAGRFEPLCDPYGLLQWHAVWHVLLAVAIVAYVEASLLPPPGGYAREP